MWQAKSPVSSDSMIKEIVFTSRAAAESAPPRPDWAVISIYDPEMGPAKLQPGWQAIHRVCFQDVADSQKDVPAMVMHLHHARGIVRFVELTAPKVEGILVHCKNGVSRSAAVAKWIAETYGLPFDQDYQFHNLYVHQLLVTAAKKSPTPH
jgi:predicted protein tyrosine phosphatase